MDRFITFDSVEIVKEETLVDGKLNQRFFPWKAIFEKVESGDRLVFQCLKASFKMIKNLFFEKKIVGVDNNLEIKDMPLNCFIQIANETKVFGFSVKLKDRFDKVKVILLVDIDNLLPLFDWSRVGGFSSKNLLEVLEREKKENLNGFTIAGGVWKNWNKLNKSRFAKSRLSYKCRFFQIDDEIITDSDYLCMTGLNFINNDYQGKVLHNVNIFDVNSLYPWIALYFPLPNGKPIKCDVFDNNKRYEIRLLKVNIIKARLKEGFIPFIYTEKINNMNWKLPIRINNKIIWLWDCEYNEFIKKYDETSIVIKCYAFQGKLGLLDSYLKSLEEMKENDIIKNDYISKYFHKKKLNLFLGKFASKREFYNKVEIRKDEWKEFHYIDNEKYIWLFAYITAMGRIFLEKQINDFIGRKNFVYCDTDSIFSFDCIGNNFLDLDRAKFGFFKKEARAVEFCIKDKKQYSYIDSDGTLVNKVAGVQCELGQLYTPVEFSSGKCRYYRQEWDFNSLIPKKKVVEILI